jgi:hypothetical protein
MSDATKIYELYVENAAANEQPQMKVNKYGVKEWRLHGKLHREDGPAIEWANGSKHWYLHGKRHREGAPAVDNISGHKEWWLHNMRHREDGAAVELANGNKDWYLKDKRYKDANAWAKAVLMMHNKPHDDAAVQKYVRHILTKDDLI